MIRLNDTAPASYDLGQLKALAQTRFGTDLIDLNTDVAGTTIYVYLPDPPNGSRRTAWTNDLAGYVVAHPTAAEQSANQATLIAKAQTALTVNATFLAVGSPNNAQTLAQVQALTKQCNGVIRLLLGQFDSTVGT